MYLEYRYAIATFVVLTFLTLAVGTATAASNKLHPDRCRCAFSEGEAKESDKEPLTMAVFGDSIMWGQGLKERDKFWCRIRRWIEQKTRRHVIVEVYAHSGAIIEEEALERNHHELILRIPPQGGEVNVSLPTINQQVETAAAHFEARGKSVDLVLVDGCINDVNIKNLLNTERTAKDVKDRTVSKCGKPMERLLTSISRKFPTAYVLVTGYYPIVYEGLVDEENGRKKQVIKGSSNNQLTRLALKKFGNENPERPCKQDMRVCLGPLSRVWYETSNSTLKAAVDTVNRELGGDNPQRIFFTEMNFPPEYGFSTKQSMLWNIRFGATNAGGLRKVVVVALDLFRAIDTNDDVWDLRGEQCRKAAKDFNAALKQLIKSDSKMAFQKDQLKADLKYFNFVCRRASLGHPNRFGAVLYAQTVIGQLQTILPKTGWVTAESN